MAIDFFDRLFFSPAEKDHIFVSKGGDIPTDGSNLIYKALQRFRRSVPKAPFFRVEIEKNIPIGAGLGGGSSNAATTLWALNELSHRPLSLEALISLGAEIGSDVPFFFSSGSAICSGRGEHFEERKELESIEGFLALLGFGILTKDVYQAFDLTKRKKHFLGNDLEKAALFVEPKLKAAKLLLQKHFKKVAMTGSGSSFLCFEPLDRLPKEFFFRPFCAIRRKADSWY